MPKKTAIYAGSIVASLTIVCLAVWLTSGFGNVGERGYDITLALVSACNRKDSARIDELGLLIESSAAAGSLGASEAKWLRNIVGKAMDERWETAARQARQLLSDQITPSPPLPEIE